MNNIKDLLFNKNSMLILSYLSKNTDKENISSHIAKELSISVGSAHAILKQFEMFGIATSRRIGKSIIYEVNIYNPMIKAFRLFDNLIDIEALISEIKKHSRKIILFGSCAKGEDNYKSDVDLFIVADSEEKDVILRKVNEYESDREINAIIIDMLELMSLESEDSVFYNEVMQGIELWEATNE